MEFEDWISQRQRETRIPWNITHPPRAAMLATDELKEIVGGMTNKTLSLPWIQVRVDSIENKLPSEDVLEGNGCKVVRDKEREEIQIKIPPCTMLRVWNHPMKKLEKKSVLWSYEFVLPDIVISWAYDQTYDYVMYGEVRKRSSEIVPKI